MLHNFMTVIKINFKTAKSNFEYYSIDTVKI